MQSYGLLSLNDWAAEQKGTFGPDSTKSVKCREDSSAAEDTHFCEQSHFGASTADRGRKRRSTVINCRRGWPTRTGSITLIDSSSRRRRARIVSCFVRQIKGIKLIIDLSQGSFISTLAPLLLLPPRKGQLLLLSSLVTEAD